MEVVIYLLAIVVANLSVAHFGASAVIINAFLLIGLDLSLRDRLHDRWKGSVVLKMGALIAVGGLITLLLGAGRVGIASTIAFMLAASSDAVVYGLANGSKFVRSNKSNVAGAVVDSIVFPTLAFGAFMPLIILGQIAAKVLGGFVWSLVLRSKKTVSLIVLILAMATPSFAQSVIVSALYDINRDAPIVAVSHSRPLPHGLFLVGFAEAWMNSSIGFPANEWSFFSKHWISKGVTKRLSVTMGVEASYNRAGIDFVYPFKAIYNPTSPKVYITPKIGFSYRVK